MISVLHCDPCTVIRIISWSPCQNPAFKFIDTKEHFSPYFSRFQFQCNLSPRVHLNFISHSDVMGATSMCLVIFYHSNKLEENFKFNCFDPICQLNYQCNVMWWLPRSYTVPCISALFLRFQWTTLNITIYCNMHCIALYRDTIVSWPMYRNAYRIVRSLPTPSSTCKTMFSFQRKTWLNK